MKKLHLYLLAFSLLTATSVGLAANDAGLPGEFLNVGVGARPMAMGKAFTSVADDIDSIYWNPAGLSTYRASQMEFQYDPLPVDGSMQFIGYSQPLYAMGNLGVGIVNVASGDLDRIVDGGGGANELGTKAGTFDHRETAYLASYAYRFGDHYASGLTLKMAEKSMDNATERGFGADWGNLYILSDRIQFGLMLRNLLAPAYKFNTETEKFPTIARGGAAVKFFDDHLLTSFELEKTLGESQNLRPHVGVEGYAINNIFLRAGWDQTEVTAGVGIRFKNMQFDYGAGFQDIGLVNRFSMKVFFGGYEVDMRATPEVFSPVGLKNKVTFHINTSHRDRVVKWVMSIRNAKGAVVKSFQGYDAPPTLLEWDGKSAQGRLVDPGEYTYRMTVTTNKNRTEMTPIRSIKILAPTPIEMEVK